MAEEPVKPKGRSRKPQPASMSMFEWAMEQEREKGADRRRTLDPTSGERAWRVVVLSLPTHLCGPSCVFGDAASPSSWGPAQAGEKVPQNVVDTP